MGRKGIYRFLIWCAVVVLILTMDVLGLLTLTKGALFKVSQPVVGVVSQTTERSKAFFLLIFSLKQQIEERGILYRELQKLRAENAMLVSQKAENPSLRQLLNLKQRLPFTFISAEVVSKDPTGLIGTVVINRGRDQNISPGDAVIDEFGNLLGLVREVYPDTSIFYLITDGATKIDAHIPGKPVLGVVSGSHGLGLSFDLISQDVSLEKEDRVVTSGLTGKLPEGLLIGLIEKQPSNVTEIFQNLAIAPAADTKDFRFVLVITSF